MIPPTMVPPSQRRPNAYKGGIIQVWVTRACDKACFGCTQGSNFAGKPGIMSLEHFEQAVVSLKDYWGVLGVFGGNPAMHPHFDELCAILRKHRKKELCGLWCNNLRGKGEHARQTFNPAVSNLNVHLDEEAYREFKETWPEALPFGQNTDSRHATPFVSMLDLGISEEARLELIGRCDVNQNWSAMICVFRQQLRGYFCEVAASQAMMQEWDDEDIGNLEEGSPDYLIPDTGIHISTSLTEGTWPVVHGLYVNVDWWKFPMEAYGPQVDFHCHRCGIPLRAKGELAVNGEIEYLTETYKDFRPKVKGRAVQIIHKIEELPIDGQSVTRYLGK